MRVYHDRGLLPEPQRDASGYRRYGADHAIRLVKIRTLVEAGVPLAGLEGGDRLFVSPEAAGHLEGLRAIGVGERTVRLERDLWILLQSVAPEHAAAWIEEKSAALSDPEFCAVYLEYDAAFDWSPDDPRLPAVAGRTRRWFARRTGDGADPASDPALTRLAALTTAASSPAWDRIAELASAVPPDEAR